MADPEQSLNSNEDQSLSEGQHRRHRGARPRHQAIPGVRGHHFPHRQPHHRTFHNSQNSVQGNFRHVDQSELPSHSDNNTDNSQAYRGSRPRPFKYHHFGRHPKKHRNQQSNEDGASNQNDSLEKPSNVQEDFSLLSVLDEKQKFNHSADNVDPRPQQYGNNYKHDGYKNRGRRGNHKDDLSLLSGVDEKQRYSDRNDRYNSAGAQGDEKPHKESKTDHYDENPKPQQHHQGGRGGFKNHVTPETEFNQFRWYGRRNFNPFGRQGYYRSHEEPVEGTTRDHYAHAEPQRPSRHRQEQYPPGDLGRSQEHHSGGYQNNHHHHRRHHKQRYQKSEQNSRSNADNDDDATQRERLLHQIKEGDLECMVCCEFVRHRDQVWSCLNCYHIFHLHCIRKWARSPTAVVEGSGWRCPTCQTIKEVVPSQYFCYCGKVRDPERNYHDTPHSCGNVCGRKQADEDCPHPCSLLCHPGPCPSCTALITSSCPCGRIKLQIRCGKSKSLTCDETCGKVLSCGVHKCPEKCHVGACQQCSEIVKQECYCSKVNRDVACTETTSKTSKYSCGQTCDKLLACENHRCDHLCHDGTCFSCRLLPENVTHCPCGRSKVVDLLGGSNRSNCSEGIPTCNESCLKTLLCGPADDLHCCQAYCHTGPCPGCPLKTNLRCRCGAVAKDFLCSELSDSFQFVCEKRCNKKRRCGRHKCLTTCCVDYEHMCLQTCNQKLTCGLHTCQELCHIGNCKPCLNASFEELTCTCSKTVMYPPIPCGTKPPECSHICTRSHPCDHPPRHNCHSEEECPPCTVLTEKWCYGNHEKRSHLPCFLASLSCGLPCQKPLICGQHNCLQICHEGPCCQKTSSVCVQPCPIKRADCEHSCGAPCHTGKPCPETACRKLINMSCVCGTRSEKLPCSENTRMFRQMSASLLASKMQDIQSGASVDISDVLGSQRKNKMNKLECNDECSIVERNRRLALALQIRNPDLSSKPGPPSYTEFLKDEARKNPIFVKSVHDKLTDLVQLAKQSKQKSRSHSFPPTNRDQRRVIHELSEYFGCETESFDQEPKRNVVVTASRDKSYLPSSSVMTVIQREMGQRKAPSPMIHSAKEPPNPNKNTPKEPIDHFDFPH